MEEIEVYDGATYAGTIPDPTGPRGVKGPSNHITMTKSVTVAEYVSRINESIHDRQVRLATDKTLTPSERRFLTEGIAHFRKERDWFLTQYPHNRNNYYISSNTNHIPPLLEPREPIAPSDVPDGVMVANLDSYIRSLTEHIEDPMVEPRWRIKSEHDRANAILQRDRILKRMHTPTALADVPRQNRATYLEILDLIP